MKKIIKAYGVFDGDTLINVGSYWIQSSIGDCEPYLWTCGKRNGKIVRELEITIISPHKTKHKQ